MHGILIIPDEAVCYPLDTTEPMALYSVLGKPMVSYLIDICGDALSSWSIVASDAQKKRNLQTVLKLLYPHIQLVDSIVDHSEVCFFFLDRWIFPSDILKILRSTENASLVAHRPFSSFSGTRIQDGDTSRYIPSHSIEDGAVYPMGMIKINAYEGDVIASESHMLSYIYKKYPDITEIVAEEKGMYFSEPWQVLELQESLLMKADVKYKIHAEVDIPDTAYIGANVTIGKGVTVGENVEIVDSYIGDNCSIGNNVRIHGSVLAHDTVVEDDTIVDGGVHDHVHMHTPEGHVHKDPTFFGVFTAPHTKIDGFYPAPEFIT